jgi:hypothetical protein
LGRYQQSQHQQGSTRRTTGSLVSSIDDILATMTTADASAAVQAVQAPQLFPDEQSGGKKPTAAVPPASTMSIISADDDNVFVASLIELVAKSDVVQRTLKAEIERHSSAEGTFGIGASHGVDPSLETRLGALEAERAAQVCGRVLLGTVHR